MILCLLKLHKWRQNSPKFRDRSTYSGLAFSALSFYHEFYQYQRKCEECNKIEYVLEEDIWRGTKNNKVTIPRFTVQCGIEWVIKNGMNDIK